MKPLEKLQVWVDLFWVSESEEILVDWSTKIFFSRAMWKNWAIEEKHKGLAILFWN